MQYLREAPHSPEERRARGGPRLLGPPPERGARGLMSKEITIPVSKETKDYLKEIGREGESYDTTLRRVLEVRHGLGIWSGVPKTVTLRETEV